jgi:hypothetical protein
VGAILPQTSWIVSPRYDLAWFFGGALVSLAVLGLYFGAGAPIAFDGPHIGAAFTRTYLDRREWAKRAGVLWKSLLCFAIGPVFLLLNLATRSQTPFILFLGFAALYSYYHVVRQHYGFLAIYKVRSRDFSPVYRSTSGSCTRAAGCRTSILCSLIRRLGGCCGFSVKNEVRASGG